MCVKGIRGDCGASSCYSPGDHTTKMCAWDKWLRDTDGLSEVDSLRTTDGRAALLSLEVICGSAGPCLYSSQRKENQSLPLPAFNGTRRTAKITHQCPMHSRRSSRQPWPVRQVTGALSFGRTIARRTLSLPSVTLVVAPRWQCLGCCVSLPRSLTALRRKDASDKANN